MRDQLQQAMGLARRTGDRLIVFDSTRSSDPYVVMPLPQYEQLVLGQDSVRDLTEDELLDRINRDIAIWKNEQRERTDTDDNSGENRENPFKKAARGRSYTDREFTGVDEIIAARPDSADLLDSVFESDEQAEKRPRWTIPSKRKEAADEVIEEDRMYLEDL
jgi:hypothetical protein